MLEALIFRELNNTVGLFTTCVAYTRLNTLSQRVHTVSGRGMKCYSLGYTPEDNALQIKTSTLIQLKIEVSIVFSVPPDLEKPFSMIF